MDGSVRSLVSSAQPVLTSLDSAELLALEVGVPMERDDPRVAVELGSGDTHLGSPLTVDSLDGVIKVSAVEEDAELVVGFTQPGKEDLASFYLRGLPLFVRASELRGISYKVNSLRLELALGSDSDQSLPAEHYHTLMEGVRRLARGPLIERLSKRLDAALRKPGDESALAAMQDSLATLLEVGPTLPSGCEHRVVACSPHGHLYTLYQCKRAAREGRLFGVSHPSPLSAAACAAGQVVLEESALLSALSHGKPVRLEQVFVLPLLPNAPAQSQWTGAEALRTATLGLLSAVAAPVAGVELGYLDYPGSGARTLPAVAQSHPFTLTRLSESHPREQEWASRSSPVPGTGHEHAPPTWVLNVEHPTLRTLLPLALREPELSAYLLIKLCLYGGLLTEDLESKLLQAVTLKRCQRHDAPLHERPSSPLPLPLPIPGAMKAEPEPRTLTFDPKRSGRFQHARFPNPLTYVLDLVQAASRKGATRISFSFGAGTMQMRFDGDPFSPDDLAHLYDLHAHPSPSGVIGPDAEARRLLATGVCKALQAGPALIQVESGSAFVEMRPEHPDHHVKRTGPSALTRIRIQQRLGFGMIKRYVDHLSGHLTEEILLQERCVHAHMAIQVDGRLISQGQKLSDSRPWVPFSVGTISGAVEVAPLPAAKPAHEGVATPPRLALSPTLLRLVQHGVWVDTQIPIELLPGFRGVAESPALQLDAAREHVVQDREYASILRAVAAAQVELIASLCHRQLLSTVKGAEPQSSKSSRGREPMISPQHLRALVRGLLGRISGLGPLLRWADLPQKALPSTANVGGSGEWPSEISHGAALLALPILPSTTGELLPLSEVIRDLVEHRTVAYSMHRSSDPDPQRRRVLLASDPSNEALLRGLFGAALTCIDVVAAPERYAGPAAARQPAYQTRLGTDLFITRLPLVGPGLVGEIGIEPHQRARAPWKRRLDEASTMRVLFLKEGAVIGEKLVPFPVPNVTIRLSGDAAASPAMLEEFQLTGIIESLFSALPWLIEQLVRQWEYRAAATASPGLLAEEDERLTWWACVVRRLLLLALCAEARQGVRAALGISDMTIGGLAVAAMRPHPLWTQLRDLPLFETLDGTRLRPADLEAAAEHDGYLAVLCPQPGTPPARIESWAALGHSVVVPTEMWKNLPPVRASGEVITPSPEPPPFIVWLDPCERALILQIAQQLPWARIADAEPWLRSAAAQAATLGPRLENLALPEDCEVFVPLAGVEGMLGVVNEAGFAHARQHEPRVSVALFRKRQPLGSVEIWLPGGQFLSAVADHPQLGLASDNPDLESSDALALVRTAMALALPKLFELCKRRQQSWPPLARMVLLEAVTALFPRPSFRLAYERLRSRPSADAMRCQAEAERDYAALLRLAVATSLDRVEAALDHHLAQSAPISVSQVTWDVMHFVNSSWPGLSPKQEAAQRSKAPAPLPGAMAWLDVLYPDSEDLPADERALNLLPALAEAPLLESVDGSPLSFGEIITDFRQHGHVLYAATKTLVSALATPRPVIHCPNGELLPTLLCLLGPDAARDAGALPQSAAPAHEAGAPPASITPRPEPSREGRLIAAVAEELSTFSGSKEALLNNLDQAWLQIDARAPGGAVAWEGRKCILNSAHPAIEAAQRGIATDAQWARFLASAVYTALAARQSFIHEEEASRFHHHLAVRALNTARHSGS